jgi:ABC-type uncharacterized transport system ATPase subunit
MHLLAGERGAGKSTVLELFAGLAWPSRGQLLVRNWPTWIGGPGDALKLAIGHVGDEPASLDRFTVAEAVVLGSEPGRGGHLARRRAAKQVADTALQVKGLWVAEGRAEPVAGLDLDVHEGEIHGLIDTTGHGAGAGRDRCGLRQQDGGRVYLGTDDLTRLSVRARRELLKISSDKQQVGT